MNDEEMGVLMLMLVVSLTFVLYLSLFTTGDYKIEDGRIFIIHNSSYKCDMVNTLKAVEE